MNFCINCGAPATEQHHIVPLALGGKDIDSNKVWLCTDCHNKIHKRGLGMGQLAAQSEKFKQAVAEGRVGRPNCYQLKKEDEPAFRLYLAGKLNATEAIKLMTVSRPTFYRYKDQWIKQLTDN